jgi:hypothetical protein
VEPPFQANAGFEEWAVRSSTSTLVNPEPSTVALFGITALIGVSRVLWRRRAAR